MALAWIVTVLPILFHSLTELYDRAACAEFRWVIILFSGPLRGHFLICNSRDFPSWLRWGVLLWELEEEVEREKTAGSADCWEIFVDA